MWIYEPTTDITMHVVLIKHKKYNDLPGTGTSS